MTKVVRLKFVITFPEINKPTNKSLFEYVLRRRRNFYPCCENVDVGKQNPVGGISLHHVCSFHKEIPFTPRQWHPSGFAVLIPITSHHGDCGEYLCSASGVSLTTESDRGPGLAAASWPLRRFLLLHMSRNSHKCEAWCSLCCWVSFYCPQSFAARCIEHKPWPGVSEHVRWTTQASQ